ncbi:hypothetical protein HPP92_007233 [Vanilla planifolia]|uniref:C2H2-type domain-containing protein n=1 Tax=Vanilla planifolia TaxID=51239 RepID=A0A835RDP4_VANPL|nr:hypothetical protein HPP92_007463 [Vanilla planifolia]KAG0490370.1 hypothetical protein HPP92_007233 [Vanilla planifolia]
MAGKTKEGKRWEEGTFRCSFCTKGFFSLQALGGHQTIHRGEIKEMRLRYEEDMVACRKKRAVEGDGCGSIDEATLMASPGDGIEMTYLRPNRPFWEAHKKLKREPTALDFFACSDEWATAVDGVTTRAGLGQSLCPHDKIDLDLKL